MLWPFGIPETVGLSLVSGFPSHTFGRVVRQKKKGYALMGDDDSTHSYTN